MGDPHSIKKQSHVHTAVWMIFKWIISRDLLYSPRYIECMGGEFGRECLHVYVCLCVKSLLLCPTLCSPVDHSPPGSPVHGILQARILEWVVISFCSVCMTESLRYLPETITTLLIGYTLI